MTFGKAGEDRQWNHCAQTPHRPKTNKIAERAIRSVKEGTSSVLLQSRHDAQWWAESMECYCYLRNVQDLSSDGKTPHERRFEELVRGHSYLSEQKSNISRFEQKTRRGCIKLARRYAQTSLWAMFHVRGEAGKETSS